MYRDAHNHLQDETLTRHLPAIVRQLAALPLEAAVVNGTGEADWPRVSDLARAHPWIIASYGVHPWDAGNRTPAWYDRLRAQLVAEPGAAVGEVGLDRWMIDDARPDDPRLTGLRRATMSEQTEVFVTQFTLAAELGRPVTVHGLRAWRELADLLPTLPRAPRGLLLHAYSGPRALIPTFAAAGAYFSFNGAFLDPRKAAVKDAYLDVPADRLLVETDAPAMPPPQIWRTHKLPPGPDGNAPNHPANLEAAYAGLAALRGQTVPDLAEQVRANFIRLFGR